MRVLHYEPAIRLELGGVVRAVLDIATQQSRGNADVTLATHDATDVPPDFPGEVLVLPGPGPLVVSGPEWPKPKWSLLSRTPSICMACGRWQISSGRNWPRRPIAHISSALMACWTIGAWTKRGSRRGSFCSWGGRSGSSKLVASTSRQPPSNSNPENGLRR